MVATIVAFVARRRVPGAVPGRAPVLSLAVSRRGFLAGTTEGALVSSNGADWVIHKELRSGRVVVTSNNGVAYAADRERVARVDTSNTLTYIASSPAAPSAIALGPGEAIFLSTGAGDLFLVGGGAGAAAGGRVEPAGDHPREILALSFGHGNLYAGGLVSGVWKSADAGRHWVQILTTPTTAVLADPGDPQRIFLGTPGGVLVSADGGANWKFTGMRSSVSGISAAGGDYFVLADRLVFRSADGVGGWRAIRSR